MIWLAFGIVSVFWDRPMGEYIPLITVALFGAFWSSINPIFLFIILYFHHLLGIGNGVFEILSFSILAVTVLISDLFYDRNFLYILYASSLIFLIFVNFGIIATIASLIEALIILKSKA